MPAAQHYSINGTSITLHRTDGNAAIKPPKDLREKHYSENGSINYMCECTGNQATLKHWKIKIGSFLAEHVLNLPDAKRRQYTLSALPEGYSLYIHYKGERHNPRQDSYLYGSTIAKIFRSPAEFFFHAKWLLLGCPTPETVPLSHDVTLWGEPLPEEVNNECMCCYCSKTSQEYISKKFSNYKPKKRRGPSPQTQARFEGAV